MTHRSSSARLTPVESFDRVIPLPLEELDDDRFLSELRAGHPGAYRELFDRHFRMLRGVLVRMLGSCCDVDDLIQETLLVVVRRVEEIREPSAIRSFVYGVAVRVARNELRKRAVRRWVRWSEAPPGDRVEPPHDIVKSDLVRRVYSVLDRMSPDLRIAFVLRFVEQYELAEGAKIAECSLATFKRRVARAELRFDVLARTDPMLVEWLERRSAT